MEITDKPTSIPFHIDSTLPLGGTEEKVNAYMNQVGISFMEKHRPFKMTWRDRRSHWGTCSRHDGRKVPQGHGSSE